MARDPHMNSGREGRKIRLHEPFNCAGVMEVCMDGKWYRTTSGWFRSFSGPRRISAPERVVQGIESLSIPVVTKEYHGPVFAMDTNFQYIGPVLNGYVKKEMLNEARDASMLD